MKLLTVQLPPFSRHLIPLRSKYSSQNPVLKHPQFMLFPQPLVYGTNYKSSHYAFSQASCYFFCRRFTYAFRHFVLKFPYFSSREHYSCGSRILAVITRSAVSGCCVADCIISAGDHLCHCSDAASKSAD
jgi:hypothetical protein